MIRVTNLHKHYGELEVLKGINLHIQKGEIVAIVGASGAGKTTLLQILGTLDHPTPSTNTALTINGTNILELKDSALSKFRNLNLGFIFQFHQLLPEFDAIENVCLPALIKGLSKKEAEAKALELMKFLGVAERINHNCDHITFSDPKLLTLHGL